MPGRLELLPPLPPTAHFHRPVRAPPYPLGEPTCRLFAWARQALWHGVRAAGLGPGEEVLVPDWHHGSEIEALLRAGLRCRFYRVDATTLEPDEEDVRAQMTPDSRGLYVTHYLGFPQDTLRWRRLCDDVGLLLIEDAAQAWLARREGRPVGADGDLAIFSLYKTYGLPEGAALVSRGPGPQVVAVPRRSLPGLARRHAAYITQRSDIVAAVARRLRPGDAYDPARDMALGDPWQSPSATTRRLLRRLDDRAAERRRHHYRFMLAELADRATPLFATLPDGASPFAFALVTDAAPAVVAALRAMDVRANLLWSVPHPALTSRPCPPAQRLRGRVVALPVHHELAADDVAHIAMATNRALDAMLRSRARRPSAMRPHAARNRWW